MQADPSALIPHPAFLERTERHDLAAGLGLAKLAMWYANEDLPFEASVAALAERAGNDRPAIRAAHYYLGFAQLSHSPHSQVMALFVVSELLRRVELGCRPKRGLARLSRWGRRRSASAGRRSGRLPTWGC